jgi:hypothetical protein
MFILKSNQKRCNPEAAYVDANGTRRTKMLPELYTEIPEPAAPEDYSTDYYYRTEQDDAPYVIYTRKSDEQIAQLRMKQCEQAVQNLLDAEAIAAGYDSIHTAVTYADEPAVPKFQQDGIALRTRRSLVWAKCYEILGEVISGQRQLPTVDELISELPAVPTPP